MATFRLFACLLSLMCCIHQAMSTNKTVTYLLGLPAQNCTSACSSRGMTCVELGAFPRNSLSIFRSINVSCTTDNATDPYHYTDQPNLILTGLWAGRCTGWRRDPSVHTNCDHAKKKNVRRLCPCEQPITTTNNPPQTTTLIIITLLTLRTTTTSNEEHNYKVDVERSTGLSTWTTVAIVIPVVLVICALFVIMFVVLSRKKNRSTREEPGPSKIVSKRYQPHENIDHGTDNTMYMEAIITMANTPSRNPTKSVTENVLYESSSSTCHDSIQVNELYESHKIDVLEDAMLKTENPTYCVSLPKTFHACADDDAAGIENTAFYSVNEIHPSI